MNQPTDNTDFSPLLLFFTIILAIPLPVSLYIFIDGPLSTFITRKNYFPSSIKIDSVYGESSEGEPLFYGIGKYKGIEGKVFLAKANEDDGLGKDSIITVWIRLHNSGGRPQLNIRKREINELQFPIEKEFWKSLTLLIFDSPFFVCLYFYLRSKKRQRLRKIQNEESVIKQEETTQKLENNEQSGN